MEKIIQQLGLDPANAHSSRSFLPSGKNIEVTTADLLGSFGWNYTTFSNKRKLYHKAKSVALRSWKGHTPGSFHSFIASQLLMRHLAYGEPKFTEYKVFCGIKFLWAENGSLGLNGALPSSEAQGDERFAADLRQHDLDKCKLLNDCTC
ncbi:hypothetical protein B0H13DRAFT_1897900 [Mycena leptocephala]|nr:hypothetical protein B0H13DRAFT_1897900 [Mycena leptocephala]